MPIKLVFAVSSQLAVGLSRQNGPPVVSVGNETAAALTNKALGTFQICLPTYGSLGSPLARLWRVGEHLVYFPGALATGA